MHEDCDLSTCSCLRNLNAALSFPTRYRAARCSRIKSNSRGSLILWAKCFAVSARSNLPWAKYESLMLAHLHRVASSLFKIRLFGPSGTSVSCSFSRGVRTLLVYALLVTILCGKSDVNESLCCSLEMFSADVVVSQLQ